MLKKCPRCTTINSQSTQVCKDCNFPLVPIRAVNSPPKLKLNYQRISLLAALLAAIAFTAAYFGGIDYLGDGDAAREMTPVAGQNVATNEKHASIDKLPDNTIEGKVVEISSGDIVTVADKNNQPHKIRLTGVDAPGTKLDFGEQAKENLAALIFDKNVIAVLSQTDETGLRVGKILYEGKDIGLEQIKAGMARLYESYDAELTDETRRLYADAETAAKTTKIGLWSTIKESPNEASAEIAKTKLETKVKTNSKPQKANAAPPAAVNSISAPVAARQSPPEVTTPLNTTSESAPPSLTAATARCADGTLSYSQTRSGTCSRHGGVAAWLGKPSSENKSGERVFVRGVRGGCYYVSASGKRNYVDKEKCN